MRSSIKTRERLDVTLRFLATGLYESLERYLYFACKFYYQLMNSEHHLRKLSVYFILGETFRSLSFQFRIGERIISEIVEETAQILYLLLKEQYLKVCNVYFQITYRTIL